MKYTMTFKPLCCWILLVSTYFVLYCSFTNGASASYHDAINREALTGIVSPLSGVPIYKTYNTLVKNKDIRSYKESVVEIDLYNKDDKKFGNGSGVVITSNTIITNYHVINGANKLRVLSDNLSEFHVMEILKIDKEKDLALLKVSNGEFKALDFEDPRKIELGEQVLVIGSPLGFTNSLSTGVISYIDRVVDKKKYLQFSAAIDHGSSGGALLSENGKLIGLVSMGIESKANISLAIPLDTILSFLGNPN